MRQDVLPADHAAVEEGQARGHEQHERGADEHPGRVAEFILARDRPGPYRLRCGRAPAAGTAVAGVSAQAVTEPGRPPAPVTLVQDATPS